MLSTELLDHSLHAKAAQLTGGLSPAALIGAYLDWLVHLAYSPGKRNAQSQGAMQSAVRLALYTAKCAIRKSESATGFTAADTCGINFIDDFRNFVEDWSRQLQNLKTFEADRFRVGHEVAATAGQVVYRNALIELTQYEDHGNGAGRTDLDRACLDH